MADKFPRPSANESKQDNGLMKYTNEGDFSTMGIGARPSGLPKNGDAPSKGGMSIEHVGDSAGGK